MTKESLAANRRYHRRQALHNYRESTRIVWTKEMIRFIIENKGAISDHVFAKKYHTTIKSIQHIFYKINLASKLGATAEESVRLVSDLHWTELLRLSQEKRTELLRLSQEKRTDLSLFLEFCDRINY